MSGLSQAAQTQVAEAESTAIQMMQKAGFAVGKEIRVSVDPKLQIMGYTHPEGKGYRVVVSAAAVDSGLLEGLLLHELSHVYRVQTGHPSHNGEVVEQVVAGLDGKAVAYDYQQKVIYDLTNNIQDLYADDIAFPIMKKSGRISLDVLTRFLQDWVNAEPVAGKDTARLRWANGWIMANNARAIAEMTRLGVEDLGGRAAEANKRFLARVDPSIAKRYGYFLDLLTNLREDITNDGYRSLLADYLGNFIRMTSEVPP